VLTKSGIIVGLGETNDEVVETMRDLRARGVDVVTIGQYLQPSSRHAPIDRWVHPDEFRWFREQGDAMGFGSVFAGPLVRSSYRADEQRHAAETRAHYPTEPSIWSWISRFISTAYSRGSSFVIGSTKPLTISALASPSERPRDMW
jgi:hypothetical protein